jgi:hypothetical protein
MQIQVFFYSECRSSSGSRIKFNGDPDGNTGKKLVKCAAHKAALLPIVLYTMLPNSESI